MKLFVGTMGNDVTAFDVEERREMGTCKYADADGKPYPNGVLCMALSHEGTILAVGGSSEFVCIYSMTYFNPLDTEADEQGEDERKKVNAGQNGDTAAEGGLRCRMTQTFSLRTSGPLGMMATLALDDEAAVRET
eukprot:5138082-Prymnesium_polylepis.1